jgi:TonB family protein
MAGNHDEDPHVRAHEIKAQPHDEGGNKWKWLAGAAVAAVVAVGGYFAIANNGPSQSNADMAMNEMTYDENGEPLHAGPLAQSSSADEEAGAVAAPAASETRRSATTQRRVTTARADDVPEQTVGVLPVSASGDEVDGVVVEGARAPIWSSAPSERRLSALYPTRALERGREGEARVSCIVENNGELDCERVSEYPANSGFGHAALRVAHMYRHAPQRWDGSSAVGSPVNLRVVFRMEDDNRRRG